MEDESCDEGFTLSNSELENRFHQIIGYVEFSNLQLHFLEKYWMEFEDVDENKFIYMDIFQEYVSILL
ncbi:hypothetical protein M8J75_001175 [Diaphorina citri]|nr:hypothetical protein M8J75_001175 [Diaphorina citri]